MDNKMLEDFFEKYTERLREINANRSNIDFSKEYVINVEINNDELEEFISYINSTEGRSIEKCEDGSLNVIIASRKV